MGIAVIQSKDFPEGRLQLDAFGSRPPQPMKPYRKKGPRPSPTATAAPLPRPFTPKQPCRSARLTTLPPQAAKPGRAGNSPRPGRKSLPPGKESPFDDQISLKRGLVMEKVKILKRGEKLETMSTAAAIDRTPDGTESIPCSTIQLRSKPEILPKTVELVDQPAVLPKKLGLVDRESVYAGPSSFVSPSPRSLPFPGFFLKKSGDAASKNNKATQAIRSVLRLDELS